MVHFLLLVLYCTIRSLGHHYFLGIYLCIQILQFLKRQATELNLNPKLKTSDALAETLSNVVIKVIFMVIK